MVFLHCPSSNVEGWGTSRHCPLSRSHAPYGIVSKLTCAITICHRTTKVLCWNYDIAGINGKTVTQPVNSPSNSTKGSVAYDFVDGCALYDLASDPAETTNVAKKNDRPHKRMGPMLARLKVLADQSVYPLSWTPPFQGPDYFCKDCPLAPVYGPTTPGSPWL